ncbi:MAG: hypothetical protein HOA58_07765 [Rhodospirillaceae bacterium]|nr:hypothetical protein [Rhodospirillaceae bacterium]MBT6829400.1 hypothetical protein [Rhodospirillaceae bacterium]MBT7291766.1 hypothetical protein [Rhodospirillaceae bacterium]
MYAWFAKILSRLTAFARDRRGVAAVEVAVVMPIFLLLFSGLIEVGRAYEQANAIEKGLRAGALYLARTGDPAAASAQATASELVRTGRIGGDAPFLAPGWEQGNSVLDITLGNFVLGEQNLAVIRIAAEVPFEPLVPGLAASFGLDDYTIRLSHEQAYVGL